MKRTVVWLAVLVTLACALSPALAEAEPVDLDLSIMPASVAYAQAIAFQRDPDAYLGQTLRIAGTFNYSEARGRGVVIIADTSGCCETSLDFACAEALCYPEDYPDLYSRFVVVGRLELIENGEGVCYLADAVMERL